jgi:2-keto-4-pentenoate hydratase
MLFKNGVIEETGLAAAVLNHPATGVAWLANKIAPYGESLEAGQVVLAGSFTRPVNAVAGDVFHADYGPLGRAVPLCLNPFPTSFEAHHANPCQPLQKCPRPT